MLLYKFDPSPKPLKRFTSNYIAQYAFKDTPTTLNAIFNYFSPFKVNLQNKKC